MPSDASDPDAARRAERRRAGGSAHAGESGHAGARDDESSRDGPHHAGPHHDGPHHDGPHRDDLHGDDAPGGAGCPLCAALDAWDTAGPEVRAHLRAAGRELAQAFVAAVEGAARARGDDTRAPSDPPPAGTHSGDDAAEAHADDAPPGPARWARRPGAQPPPSGRAPTGLRRIDVEEP